MVRLTLELKLYVIDSLKTASLGSLCDSAAIIPQICQGYQYYLFRTKLQSSVYVEIALFGVVCVKENCEFETVKCLRHIIFKTKY